MKTNPLILIVAVLCSLLAFSNTASAQGTAFTYQGRLNTGGSPANGTYDIAFWLCTANEGGVSLAGPVTNSAVSVNNGLFTTTVDFGNAFTGTSNWLQIAVSTNGANAFSTLSPRQQLTPVPYAVYAESANAANLVGTIPAGNLSGAALLDGGNTFNGNQTIQGAVGIATGQNGPAALLDVNGSGLFHSGVGITGHNTLQFGAGLPGQEISAGRIGYQTFTPDSLDIVGAGSDNTTRKIKFWAEGGAAFSGTVTANSFAGDGSGLTGVNVSAAGLTSMGNTNGGAGNFFVGPSGNATNSGSANTASGVYALVSNTSGSANTANGYGALAYNTSGSNNTANGDEALLSNASGFNNTANGYQALASNTSGSDNTADGVVALVYNTSGSENTANGFGALASNTSGSNNIALGFEAGINITGSYNIDIGNAGLSTDNNIIRIGSGQTATYLAGTVYGDGSGLTGINVTAAGLTSIGNANGGQYNFFLGASGNDTTSGSYNTANGYGALYANTSGSANNANGYAALAFNTSGSNNTANGYGALYANTSGSENAANGTLALYANTSGSGNTANGYGALHSNTSSSENTANGFDALAYNTSGSCNTANGSSALEYSTSGSYNTADGYAALQNNASGSNNIALGRFAGYYVTNSNNIEIGSVGNPSDNNIIRIGSGQVATILAGQVVAPGIISSPMWGATTVINASGPLGLTNSFTSGGGTLVISASGSGYSSSTGTLIGMLILLDGYAYDRCVILNNFNNAHAAFVPSTIVVPYRIAAGTHTIALIPWNSHTTTDVNDFFKVTVQELPF